MTTDRVPRMRPLQLRRGQTIPKAIFWHPCIVCGEHNGAFGIGFDPSKGKLGVWYCSTHLPEEHQAPVIERPAPAPAAKPDPPKSPDQGSLFD